MQQLSFVDNAFLLAENPRTPNHLCMVDVYDPSTAADGPPTFHCVSSYCGEFAFMVTADRTCSRTPRPT